MQDSKKRTWFSQDGGGVAVLKDSQIVSHFIPDSLKINTVYSTVEDNEGAIWMLTAEKGLIRFFNNTFTFLDDKKGLLTNNVRSIAIDKNGKLLIISNEGAQIYDIKAHTFENFNDDYGLSYLEPNLNAISKDKFNNFWISTAKGIIYYKAQVQSNLNVSPNICIVKKLLFFSPIESETRVFKHDQNHLSFEYSGFWYKAPESLKYRYKLENYDFDWNMPTESRLVTYSNLPPGHYTFKVEVANKTGEWIKSPDATFKFTIKSPFYRTWWFITLLVITIVGSILSIIKRRTAILKRDKQRLELEVQKRTATIMYQKEEIETQRDEIESQRDFVISQRDQISLQNDHIKASIEYASRIQQALLTPEEIFELKLRDYFILNSPMDIVSGDFYWADSKNNKLYLVVADCTGHGVPGAFMSILGMSFLEQIVNIADDLTAAQMLNLLRDKVKYALRQTGKSGESQDGMDIALLVLNCNNNQFEYSGANNPVYIIRKGELIILKPDKMPIGIFIQEEQFSNHQGVFEPGDMVYLFSDGYLDQLGGERDSKLKSKPFQEILLRIASLPVQEQREILYSTMKEWKKGKPQNDDILVVGFRVQKN